MREAERREKVDGAALLRGGVPYTVVHGSGAQRLANAWNAINSIAERAERTGAAGRKGTESQAWNWPCEKCSDPGCEHRLFTDLLAGRKG